ncbi:EcsC family protein [Catalinimonas niigatensis]|uniref:EcsC family protein n=1 Tax=Catalinimonas niigatensis TaxID=1397264 RepID=UPI003898E3EB
MNLTQTEESPYPLDSQQSPISGRQEEPYIWRYLRSYEGKAMAELVIWEERMQKGPNLIDKLSKEIQHKINTIIPEKFHQAVTLAIKQMVRSILFGSEFTTKKPLTGLSFQEREVKAQRCINIYNKLAATEGGITGAGGFLMAMADFPLFLSLKMKMLYEIAAIYGFDVRDYRERLYLLRIFQLAFSSQQQRNVVFEQLRNWEVYSKSLPNDIHAFDWRAFQLEYRDYLDLAKLAQMIPGIGAAVGVVVNYRLTNHLGKTAMNAYRMRWKGSRRVETISI